MHTCSKGPAPQTDRRPILLCGSAGNGPPTSKPDNPIRLLATTAMPNMADTPIGLSCDLAIVSVGRAFGIAPAVHCFRLSMNAAQTMHRMSANLHVTKATSSASKRDSTVVKSTCKAPTFLHINILPSSLAWRCLCSHLPEMKCKPILFVYWWIHE